MSNKNMLRKTRTRQDTYLGEIRDNTKRKSRDYIHTKEPQKVEDHRQYKQERERRFKPRRRRG